MQINDIAELFKKIFCPILLIIIPIFWVTFGKGCFIAWRTGAQLPPFWQLIFIAVMTGGGFVFSILTCKDQYGWFSKRK